MSIQDWLPEERPREKLLALGAAALSDAELLAIFIGQGRKGKTAIDMGRDLFQVMGSWRQLVHQLESDFPVLPSLGQVARIRLCAALEVSRRYLNEGIKAETVINSPQALKLFLSMRLSHLRQEVFGGLFLNKAHRVIDFDIFFEGTIDESHIYPRELMKHCFKHNAAALIFVHNHPSGSPEPSESDIYMTQHLYRILKPFGIEVLDHLIIAGAEMVSLAEKGVLQAVVAS